MTDRGAQDHTVAFRPVADYQPRHRARRTFFEWWEELALSAPAWALTAVGFGALLVILSVVFAVVVSL